MVQRNWLDQLFVFHPMPWVERDWKKFSGLPLQDVSFAAPDRTRLFGWLVEAGAQAPMLLWCHGNAGNIIHRLDNLAYLYRMGLSVFLFDYRGYGKSEGTPSEVGLYRDAQGAYLYLTEQRRLAPERLVVFGRSLGASVAVDLVARRRAMGLILESPFPSVAAVAQQTFFGSAAYWMLNARFNILDRLKLISVPILIIHGDHDTIIPIELGQRVFDAAPDPKEWYVVPGADHNDLYHVGGRPYFERLKRFIDTVVRSAK